MFQPYYVKSEYLKRVLYSGVLLAVTFVLIMMNVTPFEGTLGIIAGIAVILLAFLVMRLLSDLLTKLTGFTFFLSLFGMIMLFVLSLMLSIILGPLYFVFNLVQYFRASEV